MRRLAVVVCAAFVPAIASAAPKPVAGSTHTPPLFHDPSAQWVNVVPRADKYSLNAWFQVYGANSANDGLSLALRSGSTVVATGTCKAGYDAGSKSLSGDCSLDKDATASGPVELDVLLRDDSNDKVYVVTTLKFNVHKWAEPPKGTSWGITPDDLLAVAYVRHWRIADTSRPVPLFDWWTTESGGTSDVQLRCTVDGKQIPDFEAHLEGFHTVMINADTSSSYLAGGKTHAFVYHHVELDPYFWWGPKQKEDPSGKTQFAIDHPGAWDCFVRRSGKKLRELMFTVDDQGMIKPSAMQGGKSPVPTPDGLVMIDMKIPKDTGLEARVRPDALKKSIGFGLPWPDGAKAAELKSAFPASVGAD